MRAENSLFVIVGLFGFVTLCYGQKTPFTLCSRIVAVQESAGLTVDAALQTLDISDTDPIGCVKREMSLGPNNGLQISACQELPLELQGQKSVLALNLEIEDNKGSLRAFETDIELENGKQSTAVCFQHNVPMGSSKHADDSPICLDDTMNMLVMYVTKTCPEGLDTCVDNWFIGARGACDEPVSSVDQEEMEEEISVTAEEEEDAEPPSLEPILSVSPPTPRQPSTLPEQPGISSTEPSSGDTLFIPSDLPDDIDLPGVKTPDPPPQNLLSIDLCLRMFSTTNLVDRSTCTGFGSTLLDPIRCREDSSLFKPQIGIAYTPCAEIKTQMSPGEKKNLFTMTIGEEPGLISAQLSENIQEDRPLCISVEFDSDEDVPGKGESGCFHPWEPVSMFIAKTCRSSKVCSYHSLMINGGGCSSPRVLSKEELNDLEEPRNNLIARFGEPGAESIYGSPTGPKSRWTRCEVPIDGSPIGGGTTTTIVGDG